MSTRITTARAAAIAVAFVCCFLAVGKVLACSPGALDVRKLTAESDIVAIGPIRLLSENKTTESGETTWSGVALLEPTRVIVNRIHRSGPYQFEYLHVESDGCQYGPMPLEGRSMKVYLRRSKQKPAALDVLYVELVE